MPAHGVVHGVRHGRVRGAIHGSLPGLLAGVDRDPSSGKYVPSTAGQWATVMAAAGVPATVGATWLFQEPSGNFADPVGGFTLTPTGTLPTYQQPVAGWARLSVLTADNATTSFQNTAAGLPDVLTTSCSVLTYSQIANTGAIRARAAMGVGPNFIGDCIETSGVASLRISGDGIANGAVNSTGVVRPTWLKIDRTGSAEVLYNDLEKVPIAFSALPSGKQIRFGSSTNPPGTTNYVYAAALFGANAELSDAQIKAVLQTLGWTIPWS